jgi:DivIVA domain-containing protein
VEWVLQVVRRKRGERFGRSPWWGRHPGYAMTEVDAFCERLASTMQGGRGPGLRAVRQIEFRSQRGGYAEDEVDAFLDVVVGIMLRRRY